MAGKSTVQLKKKIAISRRAFSYSTHSTAFGWNPLGAGSSFFCVRHLWGIKQFAISSGYIDLSWAFFLHYLFILYNSILLFLAGSWHLHIHTGYPGRPQMEFLTPAWSDTLSSSWLAVFNVLFLKTMGNFRWVKTSLLFQMQKDDCTFLADTQFKYSKTG